MCGKKYSKVKSGESPRRGRRPTRPKSGRNVCQKSKYTEDAFIWFLVFELSGCVSQWLYFEEYKEILFLKKNFTSLEISRSP